MATNERCRCLNLKPFLKPTEGTQIIKPIIFYYATTNL